MGKYWKRGAVSPKRAGKGAWNAFELLAIGFLSCLLAFAAWQWFYPTRWKSFQAGWSNELHIAPARKSALSTIQNCSFTTQAGLDAIIHTVEKLNGETGGKSQTAQDINACRKRIAVVTKAHRENYVQDSLLVYSTIPSLKRTIKSLRSDSASNAQKVSNLQLGLSKALTVIATTPRTQVVPKVAAAPQLIAPKPISKTPAKATKVAKIKELLQPCNRWGDTDPRICANRP